MYTVRTGLPAWRLYQICMVFVGQFELTDAGINLRGGRVLAMMLVRRRFVNELRAGQQHALYLKLHLSF
jgi:hypothetical protein